MFAGYNTTANALGYTAYLLALNPTLQDYYVNPCMNNAVENIAMMMSRVFSAAAMQG